MRVLLDANVYPRLRSMLIGHDAVHVRDIGWQNLKNGELLRQAQQSFDVLITIDLQMQYQQTLKNTDFMVLSLNLHNPKPSDYVEMVPLILQALDATVPGTFAIVSKQ